jgi:hypothetical protein
MSKFIIAGILVFVVCGYIAYNLYQEISVILDAKRIQEQFKKDSFWETQESFEE